MSVMYVKINVIIERQETEINSDQITKKKLTTQKQRCWWTVAYRG